MSAFSEAGISAFELLTDNRKIEKAAQRAYKKIPLFPYRTIVKATIGEKGFTRLVFRIRDKMISAGSFDLTIIDSNYLKSMI